jgi:hypothetical protein
MSVGFKNISEYANADEAGRTWFTQFRKAVTSTATITSSYTDYTYFAGSPLANFYASTPLEAAYVDETRGIKTPSVAPLKQYLKSINCMSAAASATSTTNRQQKLMLCDYLMYYPFIDTDSTAQQDMIQTVTLPRYSSGQVMAIAQSASSSIGQFTMTYTNQDGVGGRVSPNMFTQIVGGGGQSLLADISGGGFNPFVPLQAGDSGVQSIESVTFTATGGGLMVLVIVQPIHTFFLSEECRRTTTGNLESYGSATHQESVIMKAGAPEIKDGAILGIMSKCQGGSLASSTLIGYIETIWN